MKMKTEDYIEKISTGAITSVSNDIEALEQKTKKYEKASPHLREYANALKDVYASYLEHVESRVKKVS